MPFQQTAMDQAGAYTPIEGMSQGNSPGNQRRRLPEDSISLRRGMVDSQQPPQLIRGGGESSSGRDPRFGFAQSSRDTSMDGTGRYYDGLQRSVNLGGQRFAFDSSGGSGDSSSSEHRGRMMHPHTSGSSGDTGRTRRSTAEDWFNSFNRDIGGYQNYDDDMPYYLPNQRRGKNPVHLRRRIRSQQPSTVTGNPPVPGALLDSTEESNSDSFRSVIDDLTVKNQKLKRRLRKLEGLHATGSEDKLFEVKMHGLPEHKRLELERLLQGFAKTLDNQEHINQMDTSSSGPNNDTATSVVPDSGYASGSRGDFSSMTGVSSRPTSRTYQWARGDPETFKMKEVVKKLEQLFTGREATGALDATGGRLPQVLQSNVTSQGDPGEEGAREASMMSPSSSLQVTSGEEMVQSKSEPEAVYSNSILEQRPTRPKDLDLQRKQVAEDNIEYLMNLTESSDKGKAIVAGQHGEGWVYLNLIINMAQLHTINVTPPFVKKAIQSVSSKLELSHDGKMVRWKGGNDGTLSSCEDGSRSYSSPEDGSDGSKSADKKPITSANSSGEIAVPNSGCGSGSGSGSGSGGSGQQMTSETQSAEDKFHYKPLFARSPSFDDDSSTVLSSDDTGEGAVLRDSSDDDVRDSNGQSRGRGRALGPLIFYKGGQFCTDLSGWKVRRDPDDVYPYPYDRYTQTPLGAKRKRSASGTRFDSPLCNKSPSQYGSESDDMEISQDEQITFSPKFEDRNVDPPEPKELAASGIGNMVLDNNFTINVETRHPVLPDSVLCRPHRRPKSLQSRLLKKLHPRVPRASIDAFYEKDEDATSDDGASSVTSSPSSSSSQSSSYRKPLRHELLSAKLVNLPPSALPPASYIFPTPTEGSVGDSDTDEYIPRSSGSEGYFANVAIDSYRTPCTNGEFLNPPTVADSTASTAMATAGDGVDKDWDIPFQLEEETDSGDVASSESPPEEGLFFHDVRANLKRSRGSAMSVEGVNSSSGMRKSQRMNSGI